MSAFDTAFTELVGIEGKYSDDERDPGNWTGGKVNAGTLKGTMYGISAAAYPSLDIARLGLPQAKSIYLTDFWDKLRCDQLPDAVAVALFKEGVNMGVEGAARVFQRSLKTTDDGHIGQITVGIANSTPPKDVLTQFLTECLVDYMGMANFKIDGKGWTARVIKTALEAKL
jgi:lysozyme family protein